MPLPIAALLRLRHLLLDLMVHFSGRILLLELQQKRKDVAEYSGDIFYSKRYSDDLYEYRLFVFPLFLGIEA